MEVLKNISILIRKLIFSIKTLKETVKRQYGRGLTGYIRAIYYSCLKLNTFIVFEHRLNCVIPPNNLQSQFKVIKPAPEELNLIRKGIRLPREFFHDRIDNLKTCYIVLSGAEIAYIHWVCCKDDYSRFLIFGEDTAEINYINTTPEFRNSGLFTGMLRYTLKDLKEAGYSKVMAVANETNKAAVMGFLQSGFKEITTVKSLGPFNKKIRI